MRPRLITAENAFPLADFTRPPVASMRPRLITAENRGAGGAAGGGGEAASMRPRLITAENPPCRLAGRPRPTLQ